jgi:hypothetical protein
LLRYLHYKVPFTQLSSTFNQAKMKASTSTIVIAATAATLFGQTQALPSRPSVHQRVARFAGGWCGVHVIQHQKPNPATDSYSLEATIFDADKNVIGGTGGPSGPTLTLASQLPFTLDIQTHNIDADPVSFQYAGQSWDSNDQSRCSVGAYDSGARQMDCGFSC